MVTLPTHFATATRSFTVQLLRRAGVPQGGQGTSADSGARVDDVSVFALSGEALGELPFGVVTLDRNGTIVRYNRAEETLAGRQSTPTVGQRRRCSRLLKNLGLECVIEGVETAEPLEMLRAIGCRVVQGYYFSKPSRPERLHAMLRSPVECCAA